MGPSRLYGEIIEIPQWTGNPGPPGGPTINDFRSEQSGNISEISQFRLLKISPSKNTKKILKAWAQSVQPPDKYKWETKPEDSWLV